MHSAALILSFLISLFSFYGLGWIGVGAVSWFWVLLLSFSSFFLSFFLFHVAWL